MKRNLLRQALAVLLASGGLVVAATPALVNSSVTAGGRQTVGSIVVNSELGGLGGLASVGALVARGGVAGQFTDVQSLTVAAAATSLNEGTATQLAATATYTDGTLLPLASSAVTWSVSSGWLASVSSSGLATAAIVYQNTNGVARADYLGQFGTLTLTVLNVNNDDFGSYAGDGIDDAWQVQYFGIGNANAAPTADPDGDGQNNLLEYLAGTSPTNSASAFTLGISAPAPGQRVVSFSPISVGRTYTVEFTTSLTTRNFTAVSPNSVSDSGGGRSVTDANATNSARYYRVRISLP